MWHAFILTALLCCLLNNGSAQNVPCYMGTGCNSIFAEVATVYDCCSMPNTSTYRAAIDSEGCHSCYAYGWVQNISSDCTSAEPQTDITAAEGDTVSLTVFFTKNNPKSSIRHRFSIVTSGTATEGEDYLISQPSSPLELRYHPVLINVTLLGNGSSGGGREAEFIDITLVQDISYSPIEEFRVLVKPTVRITIPGQCPSVPHPENGRVSLSGVSVGDRATFSCITGHLLVGQDTVTCHSNGTWDSSPPVCTDSTSGHDDNEILIIIILSATAVATLLLIIAVFTAIIAIIKRQQRKNTVQDQEPTYDYPYPPHNPNGSGSGNSLHTHIQLKENTAYHSFLLLPLPPPQLVVPPRVKDNVAFGALSPQ